MEGLTLTRLRYLHEAVRLGGIRAAADHLDVAPSAVSRQLAILARAVRSPLLEKNRRGARPTEAGMLLIEHYRTHLAREEVLISKLEGIHGVEYGTVVVGAVQGFTEDLMRRALRDFNRRYPKVSITLELGGVSDILNWLDEDRVHLGLTYGPAFDVHAMRFKEIGAADQPVCAIVPANHPLAQLASVDIDTLRHYPFALARRGYGTRDIVDRIELGSAAGANSAGNGTGTAGSAGAGVNAGSNASTGASASAGTGSDDPARHFNIVLETDHLLGLTSFVRAGMGITLLPAFAIGEDIERGTLAAVPIDHPLMRTVQARLVSRRGRELPLAAVKLQRLLIERMGAFHPNPNSLDHPS